MILIHGDNTVQSRNYLSQLLTTAKQDGKEIHQLVVTTVQLKDLEILSGTGSLFGTPQLIVLEEIHSLPKSAKKESFIQFLVKNLHADFDLIVWEKKSLTPTMIKKFPQAIVKEFKTSRYLFKWLDSLNGTHKNHSQQWQLFHQAIESDGEFMCFSMLVRQIRLLIQVKEGYPISGPPFIVQKLRTQTATFKLSQLISIHQHLHDLDQKQKTSSGLLSLEQELDLLFLNL